MVAQKLFEMREFFLSIQHVLALSLFAMNSSLYIMFLNVLKISTKSCLIGNSKKYRCRRRIIL